ncbi:MAG: RDD family protein [Pseudomonadales bacterium]|nr:RDD family protein [Pseudomonadales bacterium]
MAIDPTANSSPASTAANAAAAGANLPIAGLRRRLLAMLYDGILLLATLFCTAGAYFTVLLVFNSDASTAVALGDARTGDVLHELEVVEPGWLFYPLMLAVYIGFYLYFWRLSGQTLGMRAWKIRLVNSAGGQPSLPQLLLRMLVGSLSLACFGLGYFTLLINRNSGTWHDRISRTQVVQQTNN